LENGEGSSMSVEGCRIWGAANAGIFVSCTYPGTFSTRYNHIYNCLFGIEGILSAGFFDRNTIENCGSTGIFWTGDHPDDLEQPIFFGNTVQNCGTSAPIAGGYFLETQSKLVCNTFSNNHYNQLLCKAAGNVILNATLTLGGVTNKGTNTFEADETEVTCYGDFITCIQGDPLPGWEPLLTIVSSEPQLSEGTNNFIWAVDGTYIETKVSASCWTQPVHEISLNYFSPSDDLPGPGNNHFCPYQLFSARHGFLLGSRHCPFPIEDGDFMREAVEEDYLLAVEAEDTGNPALAETRYLGVIDDYRTTIFAIWSTAGYLRSIKQQGRDPLEAYQVLSAISHNTEYPLYLRKVAGMNAIRSLLTVRQYDSAEQALGDFLANAVCFEDSAWAILMIEAIPLLEGGEDGGGPPIQSVGGTPQSHLAAATAYHNRVLELFGHDVGRQESLEDQEDKDLLPESKVIAKCFPNPFNVVTEIQLMLPSSGKLQIDVFNLLGRRVATIVDTELSEGEHRVQWNASDMASGIYFYKVRFGTMELTKKMILIR
jgi:hypothetical protein